MTRNLSPISKKVMDRIEQGEIPMRHKTYYTISTLLGLVVFGLLALLSAYAYAIAFLWIRIASASTMAYGARDKLATITDSFPWWTIPVIIVSLIGMLYVSKKIGRLYRIRGSILAILIVIAGVALGLGLLSTGRLSNQSTGQEGGGIHERQIRQR